MNVRYFSMPINLAFIGGFPVGISHAKSTYRNEDSGLTV